MIRFSLSLLILACSFIGFGNTTVDSLMRLIPKTDTPNSSNISFELAKQYMTLNQDSSIFYFKQVIGNPRNITHVIESNICLAEIYESSLEIELAVNTYMVALHHSLKENNHVEASKIYLALGIINLGKENPAKAIDFFLKSENLALETGYDKQLAFAYTNLALAYKISGNLIKYHAYEAKTQDIISKGKENSKLKKKLVKNNNANSKITFILLIVLFLITIAVVSYLFLKLKKGYKKTHKLLVDNELQRKTLVDKATEISELQEQSKKTSGYKSEFLANISHEIRTPLNAITGYINLLQKQIDPEQTNTYIHNALIASGNLGIIINDLLDISRIEAGKMVIEKTDFNPIQIVAQAISTLKLKAEDKNIAIDLHFDPLIPEIIIGDPYRLSQILINLINNAIKFSGPGSEVSISVKCKIFSTNCKLGFSIVDKGVGIQEDQLEHIFESFTQINSNTARNQTGTGMGLAIVKRLVELQDGEIKVASKLNEGSKFSFTINYQLDKSENKNKKHKVLSPNTITTPAAECKILLVEDNEINQELAKDTILSWGNNYSVDIAENGKIALNLLDKQCYEVVLMDIQMPVMDGHEATRQIRNSKSTYANIPIIGMTAHALPHEKELAFKNGMDEYIIKPFNPDELQQKINSFTIKNN